MEREAGVWQDFIFPSVLVRIWEMEYGEKGTRKHRRAGGGWGSLGRGRSPPHTPGEIRLRAAGSQGEPGAWLDRLRPGLREGRAGRPRPLGVPDAAQRLALRKHLGPLADESLPLDSLPSAPGNQRTRQEQRRGCFPKANNQQFCFFFFPPKRAVGQVWDPGGAGA